MGAWKMLPQKIVADLMFLLQGDPAPKFVCML